MGKGVVVALRSGELVSDSFFVGTVWVVYKLSCGISK